jgi:hypothetical protein
MDWFELRIMALFGQPLRRDKSFLRLLSQLI